MSITSDIRTVAQMEMKERMKERLKDVPMPLELLIRQDGPITQQQLDTLGAQKAYQNRDKFPEVLLPFADLYHELTGQEPTKRVFTDWVDTFWAWKDEKLDSESIRMAWAQAQSDRGFMVGRPGALTITAVGCKSKAKPAPLHSTVEIERTKAVIEQRIEQEVKYVPMPDAVRDAVRAKLKGSVK